MDCLNAFSGENKVENILGNTLKDLIFREFLISLDGFEETRH